MMILYLLFCFIFCFLFAYFGAIVYMFSFLQSFGISSNEIHIESFVDSKIFLILLCIAPILVFLAEKFLIKKMRFVTPLIVFTTIIIIALSAGKITASFIKRDSEFSTVIMSEGKKFEIKKIVETKQFIYGLQCKPNCTVIGLNRSEIKNHEKL